MSDFFDLKEKVILVTGASGQLGKAICQGLKHFGAIVIGCDIVAEKPEYLDFDNYYAVDITNKAQVFTVFEKISKTFGRIDVLVNNAGVSTFKDFEDRTEDEFRWVMDVNLMGTFFCLQAYIDCYDKCENQNGGAVVNIASIFGVVSPDFRNYSDTPRKNSEIYGATKAGIIQMSKYFSVYFADRGIRVNSVSPGGIYNPDNPQGKEFIDSYSFRTPMKRMAKANEIVGAVVYFCSNAASYTTGQNLTIDGGFTAW
ncbi:SDR family oxidoreductase [Thiotrichales bacterium 19S11-10]|nr:SDR family oxidoreductase [Thiotrichales bacterium 19S11-10]